MAESRMTLLVLDLARLHQCTGGAQSENTVRGLDRFTPMSDKDTREIHSLDALANLALAFCIEVARGLVQE